MPKRPPSSREVSLSRPIAEDPRPGIGVRAALALIRAYRVLLAPLVPGACRFHPSCSAFAAEAFSRHGALRGTALTAQRLGRCHPWNAGGYDPVPREGA